MTQVARDYKVRWFLFPVNPNTKRPAFKGWQAMSTDDETQWDKWEDDGWWLGVDCGKTGIVVVDADLYKPDAAESEASLNLPKTAVQTTPRGGRHHLFSGSAPGRVNLLPGVDIRGQGNLIVWYGTLDDTPIAPVPANLVERLGTKSRKPRGVDVEDLPTNVARARVYLNAREPAIEGEGGNDHTYKTAATIRDLGLSEDKALALMVEEWNDRCVPPWEHEELAEVIAHAWDYAQNEPGAQALAGDPRTRFLGVDHGAVLQPDADRPSRYRLWTLTEALTRPPPTWIFPRILPAKAVGVVYGPTNIGKTWLTLDQALYATTGLSGYGRDECEPKDVIYFAGEGFEDLVHSRINAWCAYHEDVSALPHFRLLEDFPHVDDNADTDVLVKEIAKHGLHPRLIVLDTYARVLAQAGLNENDPVDVMKFVTQAEHLKRQFDCTILVIHHTGKDITKGPRGAQTLIDNVDFAWEVSGDLGQALQMRCEKMKGAPKPDPLYFAPVAQDDSLVLRGITATEYGKLTSVRDIYHPGSVGAALAKLGARSEDTAVTAWVLAQALYQAEAGEPEQETAAAVDRIARRLGQLGKGRLEQYCTKAGWHCPE